jgi:UDP-N-acetylmuramyl tripeptide synthase
LPLAGLPLRTRLAAFVGGAVAASSRRLGRGGGSVIGGRATLAIDPAALRHLAVGHASCLVSGTNGKTTTTSLLRTALGTVGPVVTNLLGANLPPGLVAALASGEPRALAALEVDEAWLGRVIEATDPAVVLLLNLSRDQLDRNNEVRTLATVWRLALASRPGTTVIANADDPLVAWGAGTAERVVWVGAGQPWTADASGCPACGGRITFLPTPSQAQPSQGSEHAAEAGAVPSVPTPSSAGGWACSSCGFTRPTLDVWLDGDAAVIGGQRIVLDLMLPGRANRANATMALAAASVLGADVVLAAAAMASTDEVVGRYRTVTVGGITARMLLAKNPAGWLEVLDVVRPAPQPVVVVINARIADGRDPSWLWDVPFERLAGRLVVASGERGRDLAVRLQYAEVDQRYVADPVEAVEVAAAAARQAGCSAIDVVANYTSFQTLRARLP